jgi:3-dehydroquinate synthase
MPCVDVALAGGSYPIHIGPGLLGQVGPILRGLGMSGRAAIVTHPELSPAYAGAVHRSLAQAGFQPDLTLVPQGEASKSLDALGALYTRFAEMRLDRQSIVVALGGGVIGDLAGFAAATYLRGISLAQVPTTLLAQVDASIGGKTAIDLPCGKNLAGAFHQPRAVIADIETLATLPAAELRSGLAEVLKYGMIADAKLFDLLERDADRLLAGSVDALLPAVVRSCEIKAEVVGQDPNERGLRAILNYGHTVGHALETVWGYGAVSHGAAVAIGMSAAARLAVRRGMLGPHDAERQDRLLRRLGLPTLKLAGTGAATAPGLHEPPGAVRDLPTFPAFAALLNAMLLDKKTVGGQLRFVLPSAIGTVQVVGVSAEEIEAALEEAPS